MSGEISYISGFGNYLESEAIANTLPVGQNSPQKCAHGLYAEQISGSAFTEAQRTNLRSWCYRIMPSVVQSEFTPYPHPHFACTPNLDVAVPPTQFRWSAPEMPSQQCDFIDGILNYAGTGDNNSAQGGQALMYVCNQSMDRFFYDADGELLILPQQGSIRAHTEFGRLDVEPCECLVIPRGIKFKIELLDSSAIGYICENLGHPLVLPDHGPIGPNCLANPRDFLYPTAHFEDKQGDFTLITKFQGHLFQSRIKNSPLDVVAWHGNYAPYKYDLRRFNAINTVSFDHPDPSIFTVLTSPSGMPGVANIDFVIFPERWMVAEDTFRPPYYHRNIMSEFMGLIKGQYDAKEEGFVPGGASLHNCFTPHGPDLDAFTKASNEELTPVKYQNTLAFMFESRWVWRPSDYALNAPQRQQQYLDCWQKLPRLFKQD